MSDQRTDPQTRTATDAEVRELFTLEATHARDHQRCGPRSPCRVNALAECDRILDGWLRRHPVNAQG